MAFLKKYTLFIDRKCTSKKRAKKSGMGRTPPPPSFGQCPKENVFVPLMPSLSPGSDIMYIENGRINATQLEHFPPKRKRVNKVAKRTEYPRFGGSMKVFDIQWQNYDGEGKLGRRKALSRWDGYSPDSQSASPSSSLVCPCVIFYSTTK